MGGDRGNAFGAEPHGRFEWPGKRPPWLDHKSSEHVRYGPTRLKNGRLAPPPLPPGPRDILSEAFAHAHMHGMMGPRWNLTSPWGLELPPGPCSVVRVDLGECIVQMGEAGEIIPLHTGDLFVTLHHIPAFLRDEPGSPTTPLMQVMPPWEAFKGKPLVHGGGGTLASLSSGAVVMHDHQFPLLDSLPPYLHIPAGHPMLGATINPLLDMTIHEIGSPPKPGRLSLMTHLMRAAFTYMLRVHLGDVCGEDAVSIEALSDPDIGRILMMVRMHPGGDWSLEDLAEHADMSRSAFAARFKEVVGQSPMAFITDCRMEQAIGHLRHTQISIKELAGQLGYRTDAAFSVAFKRWAGMPPGEFRRQKRHGPHPGESDKIGLDHNHSG